MYTDHPNKLDHRYVLCPCHPWLTYSLTSMFNFQKFSRYLVIPQKVLFIQRMGPINAGCVQRKLVPDHTETPTACTAIIKLCHNSSEAGLHQLSVTPCGMFVCTHWTCTARINTSTGHPSNKETIWYLRPRVIYDVSVPRFVVGGDKVFRGCHVTLCQKIADTIKGPNWSVSYR